MRNSDTTVLSVVVGDFNYDINFTLQDADGVIIDLSSATLAFNAQLLPDYSVSFTGTMDVTSAPAGTCKYTAVATDFPVPGIYSCQVVVNFPSEQVTFDNINITANARIPQ